MCDRSMASRLFGTAIVPAAGAREPMKDETRLVERLVGDIERPFRLLSLTKVAEVTEAGEANGRPISEEA
jgi:hypothetical protein